MSTLKKVQPKGGTFCLQIGQSGGRQHSTAVRRDPRYDRRQEGHGALKGEGGWTEVAGCPVFTNDDGAEGVQAMTDILTANPNLDAFILVGGWPLFARRKPIPKLTIR